LKTRSFEKKRLGSWKAGMPEAERRAGLAGLAFQLHRLAASRPIRTMNVNWDLISNFLIALLAIVNPVEKIPLWVEASKGGPKEFQWRLAALIILWSAIILLIFLLFGRQLLNQLKIDLASFKIGGGLILLQFGFSMLRGKAVEIAREKGSQTENVKRKVVMRFRQIFIPIGVPVIAGPGAITTAIIYGYQSDTLQTYIFLCLVVLGVVTILFFTLITGPAIQKVTGELSLNLISRIFGMILIAIAVQFMVEGLREVFPGWAS
jgi:multiple antibiotic resistance protein